MKSYKLIRSDMISENQLLCSWSEKPSPEQILNASPDSVKTITNAVTVIKKHRIYPSENVIL